MSFIDPKEVLETIFDEEFGLRLTNFSIKPVHVANGLARALTSRTYDTSALAKTLRRYVKNQKLGIDEERNPNEAILKEYASSFEPLRGFELALERSRLLRLLRQG